MNQYIFVKSSDKEYVSEIYKILFKCGINMAKQFLFHWFPPYSKRAIRKDCDSKFVVLVKDSETGEYTSTFQMYIKDNETLYVCKIATNPTFEGKGLGKTNMLYMEFFAKEKNCKKISLDVYAKSQRAVNFYKRIGFAEIGVKRSIRFLELIMEKPLK